MGHHCGHLASHLVHLHVSHSVNHHDHGPVWSSSSSLAHWGKMWWTNGAPCPSCPLSCQPPCQYDRYEASLFLISLPNGRLQLMEALLGSQEPWFDFQVPCLAPRDLSRLPGVALFDIWQILTDSISYQYQYFPKSPHLYRYFYNSRINVNIDILPNPFINIDVNIF